MILSVVLSTRLHGLDPVAASASSVVSSMTRTTLSQWSLVGVVASVVPVCVVNILVGKGRTTKMVSESVA